VLTNVPGPEEPLYLANAPVARVLAWVPQVTSIGIGICVLSYAGAITIGVTADQGVVADPEELVTGLEWKSPNWWRGWVRPSRSCHYLMIIIKRIRRLHAGDPARKHSASG